MPQKSYKIEFINKQEMLGMPKDRDWALIANYADKTLMKNYLMYRLSAKLGLQSPRCRFVELYINKEYLGVYLLTETIKIGKKRINIPENGTFIAEIKENNRQGQQMIYSYVLKTDSTRKPFRIHHPKNKSIDSLQLSLNKAASNNFRRWEILLSTKYIYHRHSYNSYKDAVDDLKSWIQNRTKWIDRELQ